MDTVGGVGLLDTPPPPPEVALPPLPVIAPPPLPLIGPVVCERGNDFVPGADGAFVKPGWLGLELLAGGPGLELLAGGLEIVTPVGGMGFDTPPNVGWEGTLIKSGSGTAPRTVITEPLAPKLINVGPFN